MANTDDENDRADLRSAVLNIESARLSLERIISRGSFPNTKRVIRPDGGLRDAIGQLRELSREAELAYDRQAKVN